MNLSAVPADLGSGVRFHPATLSDALVDHDADDVDRLLGIVEFDLLGGLDNRRWWFTIEVVRVVQVPVPHLADEVLRLWVSKVVTLVDLLWVRLALLKALVELLGLAPHPRRLLGRTAVGRNEDG